MKQLKENQIATYDFQFHMQKHEKMQIKGKIGEKKYEISFELTTLVNLAESSNVYELSLESVIVTVYVPTGKLLFIGLNHDFFTPFFKSNSIKYLLIFSPRSPIVQNFVYSTTYLVWV